MTEAVLGQRADPITERSGAGVPARYAGEWALFRDWCTVTNRAALPADASSVEAFLVDCPAAPSTVARRLSAIAAVHRATGLAPPERTDPVRDAARGRPARPVRAPIDPDQLAVALRLLPSHGWTAGWFGRRDRALLVLVGAGLSYPAITRLTAGDIDVRDGTGYVASNHSRLAVPGDDDPVSCQPCALVRWLRTLDFAITRFNSTRSITAVLTRAAPLASDSPHLCRSTKRPTSDLTRDAPMLPPIDQWGSPCGDFVSLTATSVSRLARMAVMGFTATHRNLTVREKHATIDEPPELPPNGAVVTKYSPEQWRTGIDRRRDALNQMRSLDRILSDVDARASELERRTLELLNKT